MKHWIECLVKITKFQSQVISWYLFSKACFYNLVIIQFLEIKNFTCLSSIEFFLLEEFDFRIVCIKTGHCSTVNNNSRMRNISLDYFYD